MISGEFMNDYPRIIMYIYSESPKRIVFIGKRFQW